MDQGVSMATMIWVALAVTIYFLPSIVAGNRNRAVGPVFVLNLFLGWTLVGWVVALVWAMTERTPREEARHTETQQRAG